MQCHLVGSRPCRLWCPSDGCQTTRYICQIGGGGSRGRCTCVLQLHLGVILSCGTHVVLICQEAVAHNAISQQTIEGTPC